jgi:hypothetical protein
MVKKGNRPGRWSSPATNSVSCSRVRTDRVVGMRGTSRVPAAWTTFSETSEIPGGESRMATS